MNLHELFHILSVSGVFSFKYKTDNQWRKEKRTKDGVVMGTYGWIDGNGRKHKTSYIADAAGYRVIKPGDKVVIKK